MGVGGRGKRGREREERGRGVAGGEEEGEGRGERGGRRGKGEPSGGAAIKTRAQSLVHKTAAGFPLTVFAVCAVMAVCVTAYPWLFQYNNLT